MIVASSPTNEPERLNALQLGLLDTSSEERFDRVTRLACYLFAVPISLVTLVDANRQWFKSRQGLKLSETPRDISFCGHAILDDQPLVVPDALADTRFSDNPLVLSAPNIRFYAGQPLVAPDGNRIGAFCIIDRRPRHLAAEELEVLKDLGAIIQRELTLTAYAGDLAVRVFRNEKMAALGQLAAGIGHELKNPLTVIGTRVEVLARQLARGAPQDPGDLQRHLTSLGEAAARMRRIMEGLSAYSKPSKPEPVPLDVGALLAGANEVVAFEARKSGVDIIVDVPTSLPTVRGDRSQLMQVLVNLATNAIQAMSETRGGALTLRARQQDGHVVIEIVDTGPGIPEALHAKVWEPFYTTKAEGTGLGLSIVRGLVEEQSDATLRFESQPGIGTTFTITLPAAS